MLLAAVTKSPACVVEYLSNAGAVVGAPTRPAPATITLSGYSCDAFSLSIMGGYAYVLLSYAASAS